jgi:tetratricopeptide (TPR) repeat protein
LKPSEYIEILQGKIIIDKDNVSSLESIIEEYPYFQSARAVYLKYLHDQGSFRYNSHLKVAAAHTLDRSVLFNYISSEVFKGVERIQPIWVETTNFSNELTVNQDSQETVELSETALDESLPESEIPDLQLSESDVVQDTPLVNPIDFEEEDVEVLNSWRQPAVLFEEQDAEEVKSWSAIDVNRVEIAPKIFEEVDVEIMEAWPIPSPIHEQEDESAPADDILVDNSEITVSASSADVETSLLEEAQIEEALEIGKPIIFSKTEKHSFYEWLQLTSLQPIVRDSVAVESDSTAEIDKKKVLIENFIKANPRMPKVTKQDVMPVLPHQRIESDVTLMTETLAQVYLEQKKYDRAIQAYQILILKNPEKSSLFADRIEKIKKLKNPNLPNT